LGKEIIDVGNTYRTEMNSLQAVTQASGAAMEAAPPPKPIIYPIAQRPQHAAARRAKELLAQVAEVEKKPAKKRISIRQLREGMGR
ncbi:hypothetical protein ACQX31_11365, partial [Corynebacterium diphtheriae]